MLYNISKTSSLQLHKGGISAILQGKKLETIKVRDLYKQLTGDEAGSEQSPSCDHDKWPQSSFLFSNNPFILTLQHGSLQFVIIN
jgi:hypothetical protein